MIFPEKSTLVKKQNELITIYEKYIELFNDELGELLPLASNHGWKSKRFEIGVEYRNKIEQLKNDIDWLQS